jgi:hypothetical protein
MHAGKLSAIPRWIALHWKDVATLPGHRPGRWPTPLSLAALLTLVAILAALVGCGDSNTGGDVSGAPDNVTSGSVRAGEAGGGAKGRRGAGPAASQPSSQGAAHKDEVAPQAGGKRSEGASKHDAAPDHSAPKGSTGAAEVRSHSGGHCPANITREQCKALAEQPISSAPSYTAKGPQDCLQAASREACERMFEAEQASHQNAGSSVAVERCLEERTRAQCEAQLAAQLEAQYAASKGE